MRSIVISIVVCLLSFQFASAKTKKKSERQTSQESLSSKNDQFENIDEKASDSDLIRAVSDRRFVDFVEGGSMLVIQVLPDDRNGSKHQKWVVQLSNGKRVNAVYNLNMCPRVNLKVGDKIAMGGQFVWTKQGGLLHWLHHDPRGSRPAGYVFVNGQFYCNK